MATPVELIGSAGPLAHPRVGTDRTSSAGAPCAEVAHALAGVLQEAAGILRAEMGAILLVEGDARLRVIAAMGLPSEQVRTTCLEIGSALSGHVARVGESLHVRDVDSDDRFRRRRDERYYRGAFLSAPLLDGPSVRGVINLARSRRGESGDFGADDLATLEGIGRSSRSIFERSR